MPADFEVALQGVDTRLKALQPGTTLGDLAYSSATANTSTRLPIGTTGQVLAVSGGVPAWTTSTDIVGANPNLVINGNFTVNQRSYVSAANLASGSYGFDRWKSNFTNTTLTYTSAPTGQSVTINSGGGLQQIVEQANVPAGTYVLSFTGTATGRIYNSGATAPSYAASPITFTADGSANVVVEFTASGATKTLSKVKLELASTPTAFCFSGGTIQSELANCQRYYWRNTAGDSSTHFSAAMGASSTTEVDLIMLFPVTMRIRPTSLDYSLILTYDGTNTYSSGTFALITGRSGVNTATVRYTHGSAALTQYRPYQIAANSNSNAYIGFSAEL